MDKIKPLFTATATATGGRNGQGFVPQAQDTLLNKKPPALSHRGC